MNAMQFTARLTRDPEVRQLDGDNTVADLRIAIPRRRGRDGEDKGAVFVDATAWNGLATVIGQYLHQGSRIAATGRLEYSEWETDDGSKRSKHEIVLDQVEFLDPKPSDHQAAEVDTLP
jgi:single-strand DNA-binding protein